MSRQLCESQEEILERIYPWRVCRLRHKAQNFAHRKPETGRTLCAFNTSEDSDSPASTISKPLQSISASPRVILQRAAVYEEEGVYRARPHPF